MQMQKSESHYASINKWRDPKKKVGKAASEVGEKI